MLTWAYSQAIVNPIKTKQRGSEMKYKLTIVPAWEASQSSIERFYETKDEATSARNAVADTLLFIQNELFVMPDYSNSIFIEQLDSDGDWVEVEE